MKRTSLSDSAIFRLHGQSNPFVFDETERKLFVVPSGNISDDVQLEACFEDHKYRVWVEVLGVMTLFLCKHWQCASEIAAYWKPCVLDASWRTPDVIIQCDWKQIGRQLFRSRNPGDAGVLDGISIRLGKGDFVSWETTDPPFPPFLQSPFKDRFVGLHGAAVSFPNGRTLLIVGESATGKTTLSREFAKLNCSFLTDEVICIHKRGVTVEPFPRAIGVVTVKEGRFSKEEISANEVCPLIEKFPKTVTDIVFLHKSTCYPRPRIESLAPAAGMRQLLTHQLQTGCELKEALCTLFSLSTKVRSWLFRHRGYEDLINNVNEIYEGVSSDCKA